MLFTCPVCLDPEKKHGLKCQSCDKKVCRSCVSSMLKVCRLGCPCYRWKCPTCRAENFDIFTKCRNPDILQGLLRDFMRIAQEDIEDE